MTKKASKNNLLTTTILCATTLGVVNLAAPVASATEIYDNEVKTVNTSTLSNISNQTGGFPAGVGIYIHNGSNITFDNSKSILTENNNQDNIHVDNSQATFNTPVTTNGAYFNGILANAGSTLTFNSPVSANQNKEVGILAFNSTLVFNDVLSVRDTYVINTPAGHGIITKNSTLTFQKQVEFINNQTHGLYFADNSQVTFHDDVVATGNGGKDILFENSTGTFNGNVNAGTFHLKGAASTINFDSNVELGAAITTETTQEGTLTFKAGAKVLEQLGTSSAILGQVNFTSTDPNDIVNLNKNIYAGSMQLKGATFKPVDGTVITSGNINLDKTIFDLGANTLKFNGNLSHDDANGEVTINTTYNGSKAGHIEMTQGGDSINLTQSKGLKINITYAPNTPLPAEGETREVDMFVKNGGALTLNNNANIVYENPFVIWSADTNTGVLSETRKPQEEVKQALEEVLGNDQTINQNLDVIANSSPELYEEIINAASNAVNTDTTESASAVVDRIIRPDAVALATAPVYLATQDTTQIISNKLKTISSPVSSVSVAYNPYVSGVASGDNASRYGAWISPAYGMSTQKLRKNSPGYKSSYYGAVLGVDGLINDCTAVGLAFSYVKTDVKHKDQNSGDKTKIDSYVISAYGTYELLNNWFMQSVASFGYNQIKNAEIRIVAGSNKTASASYKSTTWGAELLTGYNYKIQDDVTLTPSFGFEFNRINAIDYTESGAGLQNFSLNRKAINHLEAIAGAKLSADYVSDNMIFTPEIHANARYELLNDKLKVDIKQQGIQGVSLIPKTGKQARMVYNAGVGMNIQQDAQWEYSVGYDLRLAEKYTSHQGTLKLRMNF